MRSTWRALRLTGTSVLAASALAAMAVTAGGTGAMASVAHTHAVTRSPDSGTRFYVPPPDSAAVQQFFGLLHNGDIHDATLLAQMEAVPRAVWFTNGTPAQVQQSVQQTITRARFQRAEPLLVAYDIPGRDCAQFSAGGALNEADYEAWISAFAAGIGSSHAIVILEPDSLGLLPSSCGGPSTNYPFTDAERIAELNFAVTALAADPNVSVYMDGTHSAWQSVGTMAQRLLEAGVQQARGFFVNVSNFQPTPELTDYGTWISDCIAMVTDPSNAFFQNPQGCASQYFPATQSDFSTWGLTTAWYAQNMGNAVATTHFVEDTSRNGNGPNNMSEFASAPFDQPSSVISSLASGNWCNPPGSGLGLRPTSSTGVPLLDAYLWVKIPGESDGQCDLASGVRAWNFTDYTLPSWPTDSAGQAVFDPLWGQDDPAAGTWFPAQALQLAQDANPKL